MKIQTSLGNIETWSGSTGGTDGLSHYVAYAFGEFVGFYKAQDEADKAAIAYASKRAAELLEQAKVTIETLKETK